MQSEEHSHINKRVVAVFEVAVISIRRMECFELYAVF